MSASASSAALVHDNCYPRRGSARRLGLLAPTVLGMDPRPIQRVYDAMDGALKGHEYAKSAIDMACWDLLGKSTGLSFKELLGGGYQENLPL